MIFAFIIHIEFCSALWNRVQNVASSNCVRQVGWSLARGNLRAVLGRAHFPALSIIYSNYYQCLCAAQIKHGGPQTWKRRARHRQPKLNIREPLNYKDLYGNTTDLCKMVENNIVLSMKST